MELIVVVIVVWILLLALSRSLPGGTKRGRRKYKRGNRGMWRGSRRGRYIYIYKLKDGRRTFYVGQTTSPSRRLTQHIEDANKYGTRKQQYIYWMLRGGRVPKMDVIVRTKSKNKANSLEIGYISKWGTHNTLHR